jgi:methylmalonyl-CoA/ethylmalonyl-CoA epimerase
MKEYNFFGSTNPKLHHIGLVVKNIQKLELEDTKETIDPVQKVKVAFVFVSGLPIELIEPVGRSSPAANSLKKNNKLVHMCFEVDSIESAIKAGKENKFRVLSDPVPAEAFEKRNIAWLFHDTWGLVELVERE